MSYCDIHDLPANFSQGRRLAIGKDVVIVQPCVIGSAAEIRGEWRDEGAVEIGDRTVIREFTAIQGRVKIGADCYIMDKCHIAHDNVIGDGVTMAPGVMLAGHVEIGDHATLGIGVVVHQRVKIGEGAMIGMGSVVTKDVPPWRLWYGNPAKDHGWNLVGLKRNAERVAWDELQLQDVIAQMNEEA